MIYQSALFAPRFLVRCEVCSESKLIKSTEEICMLDLDSGEKIKGMIEDSLAAQADADGWDGNFCPSCVWTKPSLCRELSEADDDRTGEEG